MRILMWFALGFGAACVWGGYFGSGAFLIGGVLLLAAVAGMAVMGREKRAVRCAALLCVGCLLGLCWLRGYEMLHLQTPQSLDGEKLQTTVRLSDYHRETAFGLSVDGTMEYEGRSYALRLYLNSPEEPVSFSPGDEISGEFVFRSAVDDPVLSGRGIYLTARPSGIYTYTASQEKAFRDFPARLRHEILGRLEQVFSGNNAVFAKALLMGEGSGLDYETDTAFKISGIRHIVAVSGLHISILFSLAYLFTGRRRIATALVGIPLAVVFAAVTGFTPSVVRASVMQILMIVALLCDREYDPPTALSFAALTMLLWNPLVIRSVGFQLSFGCVAGILLFSERIYRWLLCRWALISGKDRSVTAKIKRWFASSVSITLGSMVFSTPLCAWHFGTVSLVGIVTNLLILWLVTYLFCGVLLVCLLSLIWLPAAQLLGSLVSVGIWYVQSVAKLLSQIPVAAVYTKSSYVVVWLILCYVLLAIFVFQKKKQTAVLAGSVVLSLCLALMLSWLEPLGDECRVTVLDVGQGQSILLQAEGKTYLVDCGGSGGEIVTDEAAETLLSQGVFRLDGLILTHYDADHAGGAADLLTRVDADAVVLPAVAAEKDAAAEIAEKTHGTVLYPKEPMELTFGKGKIGIFPSNVTNSGNESSLCVLFQTENCAILITGDRDSFGERMLLRQTELPELDVLVVGHHGSKYSTSQELLEATSPEIAIISVGKSNPYGHPAQEVLDRLRDWGCVVYRTDENGTIVFRR